MIETTTEKNAPCGIGFAAAVLQSAACGMAAGTTFGAFDALFHGESLTPADALVAMGFGAIAGMAVLTPLGVVSWFAYARAARRPTPSEWCQWLIAATGVLFVAALVLVGTSHNRDAMGWLVIAASVPAMLLAARTVRSMYFDHGGRGLALFILLTHVALVACPIAVLLRSTGLSRLSLPIAATVAIVLVILELRLARRSSRATLLISTPLLLLATAAYLLFGNRETPLAAIPPARGATGKPNVVLIVLDTTRADHMGCYGHTGGLTPELDRLAAEGVVFEHAYSPSPWTTPSHASMFTGLHPQSHGVSYEHHLWLEDDIPTLASLLRSHGYQTAAFTSNFRLAISNVLRGFDTQVRLDHRYSELAFRDAATVLGWPRNWADKGGGLAAGELRRWLKDRRDPLDPVLLFFNLFEAHAPYLPPREFRARDWPVDLGAMEAARLSDTVLQNWVRMHVLRFRDPKLENVMQSLYREEIRYQDHCLSEIMAVLRATLDMDNTLVIVTADHGENLGQAGRWGHVHALNDDLLRVPLVLRGPKGAPRGTRVRGDCQTVDILPTVLNAAGLRDAPTNLPGRNLLSPDGRPADAVYAQDSPFYPNLGVIEAALGPEICVGPYNAEWRMWRRGSLKYIWSSDGGHALYDLSLDPAEDRNLMPARRDDADKMRLEMESFRAKQPAFVSKPSTRPARSMDRNTLDKLKRLGYFN